MQETTDLFKAFISSSLAASCFSFSSSWRVAMPSFSVVRSSSVSSCLAFVISSSTSSSALDALSCEKLRIIRNTKLFQTHFQKRVSLVFVFVFVFHLGSFALLLANVHAVAGVVLLHLQKSSIIRNKMLKDLEDLHSLHLLFDGFHGDVVGGGSVVRAGSRDESRLARARPPDSQDRQQLFALPAIANDCLEQLCNNELSTFKRQRGNV